MFGQNTHVRQLEEGNVTAALDAKFDAINKEHGDSLELGPVRQSSCGTTLHTTASRPFVVTFVVSRNNENQHKKAKILSGTSGPRTQLQRWKCTHVF